MVVANLNSDMFPEIIFGTDTGDMHIMHLDGSTYNHSPISFPFSYHSAPIIRDIDSDGDLEILAGTSLSINAIDIKEEGHVDGYWSMYKGGSMRRGFHAFAPECSPGDINEDGSIDVLDITQQVNFILEITEPTSAQMCASNINLDANLDLLDIVLLVSIVLNQ